MTIIVFAASVDALVPRSSTRQEPTTLSIVNSSKPLSPIETAAIEAANSQLDELSMGVLPLRPNARAAPDGYSNDRQRGDVATDRAGPAIP
jgi:hypothetical protein